MLIVMVKDGERVTRESLLSARLDYDEEYPVSYNCEQTNDSYHKPVKNWAVKMVVKECCKDKYSWLLWKILNECKIGIK